ncbi:hypothetical protein M2360_000923 [Rhizobium sp. SG_E_25_P2]|uniref:hypothetical protein n=1 Tax=Rhizobium sp. SG_E_25_P2 TaxID=2879942 RepID=UPI002474DB67|nr:hypothetical protein [Rhizobium sp. SG_E_25_P2]MDH6265533.1 hypothetical protein [Rhizobium sp. SG_E_25_P2]
MIVFSQIFGAAFDAVARVRFLEDFDYRPSAFCGRVDIAYLAGMELPVKRECADAAIAAGKAVEIKGHRRDERKDWRRGVE